MASRPRVFVPQIPTRRDTLNPAMRVPSLDLKPAAAFGELVELVPHHVNTIMLGPIVPAMREILADATPDDYLLAVGAPALISVASAILARKFHSFRLLQWDRIQGAYLEVEIKP